MKGYSAISRAGIEDDGLRASNPTLRLRGHGSRRRLGVGDLRPEPLRTADRRIRSSRPRRSRRTTTGRAGSIATHPAACPCCRSCRRTPRGRGRGARSASARDGHRGAIISPFEFRCSDPAWERFWDVAEEVGLPISFHIGQGTSQVRVAPGSWELAAFSAVGPMQLDEPLAMMIYSGVLERHPKLRLVLAESGIGWLPYFVNRLDAAGREARRQGAGLPHHDEAERDLPAPGLRHVRGGAARPRAAAAARARQLHVGVGLPASRQHVPALARGHRTRLRRAGRPRSSSA